MRVCVNVDVHVTVCIWWSGDTFWCQFVLSTLARGTLVFPLCTQASGDSLLSAGRSTRITDALAACLALAWVLGIQTQVLIPG